MNTRLGIEENIEAAIGYIIPIFAMIAFFIEQENNFVRFHSLQSIILSLVIFLIFMILSVIIFLVSIVPVPFLSCLCSLLLIPVGLLFLALAIFLATKAYNREIYKLPLIGDHIERIIYKY